MMRLGLMGGVNDHPGPAEAGTTNLGQLGGAEFVAHDAACDGAEPVGLLFRQRAHRIERGGVLLDGFSECGLALFSLFFLTLPGFGEFGFVVFLGLQEHLADGDDSDEQDAFQAPFLPGIAAGVVADVSEPGGASEGGEKRQFELDGDVVEHGQKKLKG